MGAKTIVVIAVAIGLSLCGILFLSYAAGQAVMGADLSQVDPTQTVPPEPGSSTPTAAGRAYAPVVFELARTATATRPPTTPTIGPTHTVPPPPGTPTPTAAGRATRRPSSNWRGRPRPRGRP